jgi:H+/Cl- antiporter ClcA
MRGELIVPLAVGVVIGLVAGVIGFGVPAAAVFGNSGDRAVGWATLVPILVCGAVCGYVALLLATRDHETTSRRPPRPP